MKRHRRRAILFGGVLVLAACYTVHMDERQVRTTAAADLDCDESFVELQTDESDKVDVARYTARGCGKVRSYVCTTDEQGYVSCQHPGHGNSNGDDSAAANAAGQVAASAVAAGAGCACAALLGSKGGGGGSGGGGGGATPGTPVRSR